MYNHNNSTDTTACTQFPELTTEKAAPAPEQKRNPILKFISTALVVVLATTAGYIARTGTKALIVNARNHQTADSRIEFRGDDTVNPEFDALLEDWGITYPSKIADYDSEIFGHEDGEGVMEIIEVGYKKDIVREMVNTIYFDVTSYPESDKQIIWGSIQQMCTEYEKWDFVSAHCQNTGNYFCMTLRMKDLDERENVQALGEMGMAEPGAQELRMSITVENFQALGYTQR